MYWRQVWNKSQTYFDGRFNGGAFFISLTVRPSTDGKRAPLTAINLQAAGSPQQAPPTYIAKMWKLIKFRKNVIFSRNHTTKTTIRTTIHENFSKMKNLKVDRWALSLSSFKQFVLPFIAIRCEMVTVLMFDPVVMGLYYRLAFSMSVIKANPWQKEFNHWWWIVKQIIHHVHVEN